MSNVFTGKPLAKPLKGGSVNSNIGSFNTLNVGQLNIDSLNIPGTFEDGIMLNLIIQDSEIINTTIGLESPNAGVFTTLQTLSNVTFLSSTPGDSVNWDPLTGLFSITSEFQVNGCSKLGNIQICNNDIKSVNLNGDINISPNGLGTLYLNAPIINQSSNGNYVTEMRNGSVSFIANTNLLFFSSRGSNTITTFGPQTLTARNGDLVLNVDTDRNTNGSTITNVEFTGGNILINTLLNHNLTSGNVIDITSNSLLSGAYTVGNIFSDTAFILSTTTNSTSTATGGTFIKTASNNIILNSSNLISIPSNTRLIFGNTQNAVSGSTNGLLISSISDIDILADRVILPQNSFSQFGSSGNNTITFDGTKLIITSSNDIELLGDILQINTTNVKVKDPIITIADYILTNSDNKDRGIEYNYYDTISESMNLGWFGRKSTTNRFTFYSHAINSNEIISGTIGDLHVNNAYIDGNLNLLNPANVNLNCGEIINVSSIVGCNGNISINGTSTVTTNAQTISLLATNNVFIPTDIPLEFGNTGNSIVSDTFGNVIYSATNNTTIFSENGSINFSTSSFIRTPDDVPIYIGNDDSTYIINSTTSSSSNLIISNSSGDIEFFPESSFGNILIPHYNKYIYGSTDNTIYGDGNQLVITGYNGIYIDSPDVILAGNINIIGSINATSSTFDFNDYILPLGTYQVLPIINIINSATTGGNIEITTSLPHNFVVGDEIILRNTDSIPTVDGLYNILTILSNTEFKVSNASTLSTPGNTGNVKSNLTTQQGKDVGIQVNYWSSTGNVGLTAGTLGYKTGFFGFDQSVERWAFYADATIFNSIVTGDLGDIDVNKVFTNRLSGFVLDGPITADNNNINGTNFTINGGTIDSTTIGLTTAESGRFTTLTNTISASLNDVTLESSLIYNLVDKYTLSIIGVQYQSPSPNTVVSMFSVSGLNYTGSSGTMPTASIVEGSLKILVCQSMGSGCTHTVYFEPGKLIAPNPLNESSIPTRIVFKRKSQNAQLLYDGDAWILLGGSAYVFE